jgi:hypothetical protein
LETHGNIRCVPAAKCATVNQALLNAGAVVVQNRVFLRIKPMHRRKEERRGTSAMARNTTH